MARAQGPQEKKREVSMADFSTALRDLKNGFKVARTGWNGKGMFIFYNPMSIITVSEGRPLASALPVGTSVKCLPYIMMKTANNAFTIVPWLASQTDILADDWVQVD